MTATDEVYVSDLLATRHPSLHVDLRGRLDAFGIALREIAGTHDIWCRDYMPVPIGDGRFVQFRYAPSYLADAPKLITPPEVCERVVGTSRRSDLVVDGGNVVRRGPVAVMTDQVFIDNADGSRKEVERELREVLNVERVVIIPVERGDVFGHADGVLHLVNENLALVNDYSKVDPGYGGALGRVLRAHRIDVVPLTYAPDLKSRRRIPPATGVYVNMLETPKAIFVPVYGVAADELAIDAIGRAFGGRAIVSIDCRAIACDGGSLHCVTWMPMSQA